MVVTATVTRVAASSDFTLKVNLEKTLEKLNHVIVFNPIGIQKNLKCLTREKLFHGYRFRYIPMLTYQYLRPTYTQTGNETVTYHK